LFCCLYQIALVSKKGKGGRGEGEKTGVRKHNGPSGPEGSGRRILRSKKRKKEKGKKEKGEKGGKAVSNGLHNPGVLSAPLRVLRRNPAQRGKKEEEQRRRKGKARASYNGIKPILQRANGRKRKGKRGIVQPKPRMFFPSRPYCDYSGNYLQ